MTQRPTLGSGSALGWAHIGVLRALVEEGIAPNYVAGCSMGAMVGAAFDTLISVIDDSMNSNFAFMTVPLRNCPNPTSCTGCQGSFAWYSVNFA